MTSLTTLTTLLKNHIPIGAPEQIICAFYSPPRRICQRYHARILLNEESATFTDATLRTLVISTYLRESSYGLAERTNLFGQRLQARYPLRVATLNRAQPNFQEQPRIWSRVLPSPQLPKVFQTNRDRPIAGTATRRSSAPATCAALAVRVASRIMLGWHRGNG